MVGFLQTAAGAVPRVRGVLSPRDHLGTIGVRTGILRNNYKVTPGLYAVGSPSADSPVVVTANYKLTFDMVRRDLETVDVWLLVVDTRGINVWCAAGKGTFSTAEVAYQVKRAKLAQVVTHRTLILPQLSATGVDCLQLKSSCGFRGVFGPVRVSELPEFLAANLQATERMRAVTFTLKERMELVPVEVFLSLKPLFFLLLALLPISGIGPGFFSIQQALTRTGLFLVATVTAIVAGTVLTPLLLKVVRCRQFWLKGAIISLLCTVPFALWCSPLAGTPATIALSFWIIGAGSFLAMNFTGSSPYTSLSGVELEMRRGLPFQLSLTALALITWLVSPFMQL